MKPQHSRSIKSIQDKFWKFNILSDRSKGLKKSKLFLLDPECCFLAILNKEWCYILRTKKFPITSSLLQFWCLTIDMLMQQYLFGKKVICDIKIDEGEMFWPDWPLTYWTWERIWPVLHDINSWNFYQFRTLLTQFDHFWIILTSLYHLSIAMWIQLSGRK